MEETVARRETTDGNVDALKRGVFTPLQDAYLATGNPQMAAKVALYCTETGCDMVVYRHVEHPDLVGLTVFHNGLMVMDTINTTIKLQPPRSFDKSVDLLLSKICERFGVSETKLRMKLELMGN